MNTYISLKAVAKEAGIGISTARLWCCNGRLSNAVKIGRDWVVPEADLIGLAKPKRGRPGKIDSPNP